MNENEKIYADYLDKNNIKWIFHPKRFNLGKTTYQPDFLLVDENKYIEIMANKSSFAANKKKIFLFRRRFKDIKFEILSPKGEIYSFKRKIIIKETRINLLITEELKYEVRSKCIKNNTNISKTITDLLTQWIKE